MAKIIIKNIYIYDCDVSLRSVKKYILLVSFSQYSSCEVIILAHFNVHNEAWAKSNKANTEGRVMEAFAISYRVSELVSKPVFVLVQITEVPALWTYF